MKNLGEILIIESDPRHDFDRVGNILTIMPKDFSSKEDFKALGRQIYFMANGLKHVVRGGLVGLGIGAAGFYIAGENPDAGAIVGGALGLNIDLAQYMTRGIIIPVAVEAVKNTYKAYNWIKRAVNRPENI